MYASFSYFSSQSFDSFYDSIPPYFRFYFQLPWLAATMTIFLFIIVPLRDGIIHGSKTFKFRPVTLLSPSLFPSFYLSLTSFISYRLSLLPYFLFLLPYLLFSDSILSFQSISDLSLLSLSSALFCSCTLFLSLYIDTKIASPLLWFFLCLTYLVFEEVSYTVTSFIFFISFF